MITIHTFYTQRWLVYRSVNSGDAFILMNLEQPQHFVWFGHHSNSLEHSTAINLATTLCAGAELLQLHDGDGDERFWELLGGARESRTVPPGSSEAPEVCVLAGRWAMSAVAPRHDCSL